MSLHQEYQLMVIVRTDSRRRDSLPCVHSPAQAFLLLSMLSGAIYLRLEPHLGVEISSDTLTENCCQVSVLPMMFCAPTAGCVLTWLAGKSLRNKETHRSTNTWVDFTPWDNILYFWFPHFTSIETHRCQNFSLSLFFNIKRFSALTQLLAIKTVSKIVGLR